MFRVWPPSYFSKDVCRKFNCWGDQAGARFADICPSRKVASIYVAYFQALKGEKGSGKDERAQEKLRAAARRFISKGNIFLVHCSLFRLEEIQLRWAWWIGNVLAWIAHETAAFPEETKWRRYCDGMEGYFLLHVTLSFLSGKKDSSKYLMITETGLLPWTADVFGESATRIFQ